MSRQISVTPAAVAQWELGMTRPASSRLVALSKALRVPLDWLLTGTGATSLGRIAVRLETQLVQQAHAAGIDVTFQLELRLRELVADARRQRWLEDNRTALQDANRFLSCNGLWSDGRRQF